MRNILLGFALLAVLATSAQQISGAVNDERGNPLSGATISLMRAADSSGVITTVTKEGLYRFHQIMEGAYLVRASHVGYETVLSAPFTLAKGEVTVPSIVLHKATGALAGVTVSARKRLVEVKGGKTILNVEGTVNAVGSDALDLLRQAPGVTVDKDDNLSVSGKNGVRVYVDGRPTPLSAQDLSNYLKTLQSSQIEAIEIITNPSAQYEAAGNAGIINIRLKKNRSFGTNGTAAGGWNIGTYAKYNAGLSLNHRNKNLNLFGTYNYQYGRNKNGFTLYREVLDTFFRQASDIRSRTNSHQFKAGMDYFLNAKNVLGVMVNGNFSDPEVTNASVTPIGFVPTHNISRIMVANNHSTLNNKDLQVNLNYAYTDSGGRNLTVNGDYGFYDLNTDQVQPNYFYDATGKEELGRAVYRIITPTTIDIYSLKADYEQSLKGGKLAIGGKAAYVTTDNHFRQYNVYQAVEELDRERSNRFLYKENIHAGYVQYTRSFKGIQFQGGLRVENTALEGRSEGQKKAGDSFADNRSTFTRNYTDLFPSASITFNRNPRNVLGLTYSRRIDRPVYQDLNPFEYKINEYTFHRGSIDLRPQYTNSFGITHTYGYKLNTTLNYSRVKDMFAQIVDTAEGVKGYLSGRNLASQDIVSLNISYPFQYKAYSVFAHVNTHYARYEADYGPGRRIDTDVWAFNLYAQNTLRFAGTWTAELTGFYTSPAIWQGGMKSIAMWGVNGGIQKQVMKGKGNFKVSVSDLFRTMKWGASNTFAGQFIRNAGSWESRQLKLHFSYRFGNKGVKEARNRASGAEEESKRVQSGEGKSMGH